MYNKNTRAASLIHIIIDLLFIVIAAFAVIICLAFFSSLSESGENPIVVIFATILALFFVLFAMILIFLGIIGLISLIVSIRLYFISKRNPIEVYQKRGTYGLAFTMYLIIAILMGIVTFLAFASAFFYEEPIDSNRIIILVVIGMLFIISIVSIILLNKDYKKIKENLLDYQRKLDNQRSES